MSKFIVFLGLCLIAFLAQSNAQKEQVKVPYLHRSFQVSLVPGVSTNGLNTGYYTNNFSINVFSGYSGGNSIFELGLISNHHREYTSGIQIGGLFNVTGANRFSDFRSQPKYKDELANPALLSGFQIAGISNIVRGNAKGFQGSGLMNTTSLNFTGFQLALGVNHARESVTGFQFSLISNVSNGYMAGIQTSALLNVASESLYGIQLGAVNVSDDIYGPKSWVEASSGLQFGLVNVAGQMDGYQIGLVNFAGKAKGIQIGLVNFSPSNEGWPIGLLNLNSLRGHVQVSTNDIFNLNYSIATGNKNIQNTLEFGQDSYELKNSKWGLTYLIGRRKDIVENYMLVKSYKSDLGVTYIKNNAEERSNQSFLLSMRFNGSFRIIHKTKYNYFFTIGPALYVHFSDKDEHISNLGYALLDTESGKLHFKSWIGYHVGLTVF